MVRLTGLVRCGTMCFDIGSECADERDGAADTFDICQITTSGIDRGQAGLLSASWEVVQGGALRSGHCEGCRGEDRKEGSDMHCESGRSE
jgi:hypothetical protein